MTLTLNLILTLATDPDLSFPYRVHPWILRSICTCSPAGKSQHHTHAVGADTHQNHIRSGKEHTHLEFNSIELCMTGVMTAAGSYLYT
ncbi:hypothetical protein F4806DRAFT_460842 [Annulohypoxylon nitens]|nr:hypothetical protein F4806DRAFT_460842 [Annulohypoxylon nitens]